MIYFLCRSAHDAMNPRPQFRIRTLLFLMASVAILAASYPGWLEWANKFYLLFGLFAAFWSFRLGQFGGRCLFALRRYRMLQFALCVGFACTLGALCLVLYVRRRRLASFDDPSWPRPWPYPDDTLLSFHDWLNARNPAPPGLIKIHGEFYAVLFLVSGLGWLAFALAGMLLGAAAPEISWRMKVRSAWQSIGVRLHR